MTRFSRPLCDLFADEGLDVSACATLAEMQARVVQYPGAVVVADSWETSDCRSLSPRHRAELGELAQLSEIILTPGSEWARNIREGEFGPRGSSGSYTTWSGLWRRSAPLSSAGLVSKFKCFHTTKRVEQ
jgi:hypothetical protein